MSMERCCQAQLMAEAAGSPVIIPHDTAVKTREFIANDMWQLGQATSLHLI
jgi:hypothetical protein